MPAVIVFLTGALFAVGLSLGGMTQPHVVIGFLDVFGAWNPSLAFVMGGAVLTYAPLFRLVTRRNGPVFASLFQVPTRRDITPSLVAGSALFGIGWGLAGFCPGPGVASLGAAAPTAAVFVLAMLAGMGGYSVFDTLRSAPRPADDGAAESPGAP